MFHFLDCYNHIRSMKYSLELFIYQLFIFLLLLSALWYISHFFFLIASLFIWSLPLVRSLLTIWFNQQEKTSSFCLFQACSVCNRMPVYQHSPIGLIVDPQSFGVFQRLTENLGYISFRETNETLGSEKETGQRVVLRQMTLIKTPLWVNGMQPWGNILKNSLEQESWWRLGNPKQAPKAICGQLFSGVWAVVFEVRVVFILEPEKPTKI